MVGNSVDDTTVGNEITANRIFGNKGQAIDLGNDGVTYNSASPRIGPNDFQNFPIIFTSADGQLEGGLWGSSPSSIYRVDLFASAAYGPGGAGEAQDYLGSLEVTTDSHGQVVFDVPFTPPAGLPIVTATATDPWGNTSEVSALRRATLEVPPPALRVVANQPLVFSAGQGDGFAIQDPDAGPFNLTWNVTLSVSAGTLWLSSTAGLTGSGDGTGSLSYSGPLTALDAALNAMTYTPAAGPHVFASVTGDASSYGAPPLQAQFVLTDGVFVVNTTADSGPGSFRQAILDSNIATGGTNTIDFDIPGSGVQTIAPTSALPAITNPVVIDGTSQPGYAGAPLIAIAGQGTGDAEALTVGSDVTAKGLAIGGYGFSSLSSSSMFTIESIPLPHAPGAAVTYQIVVTAGEDLMAIAQARGTATSLSLLDALGQVVARSDGLSAATPVDTIATYLAAGTYSLQVQSDSGGGDVHADGDGDASLRAVSGSSRWGIAHPRSWRATSPATAASTWPSPTPVDNTVSVLLGNGDGTFQPQVTYAVGIGPRRDRGG